MDTAVSEGHAVSEADASELSALRKEIAHLRAMLRSQEEEHLAEMSTARSSYESALEAAVRRTCLRFTPVAHAPLYSHAALI